MSTPAGWYADPQDQQQQRYWDGTGWTEHLSPAAPVAVPETVAVEEPATYAPPAYASGQLVTADPLAHLNVAGSGARFGGYCLDILVGWIPVVSFVWMMVAWTNGQTPGKSMNGTVVVDARTGQQVGWGRMFLRQVIGGFLITVCTLGISFVVSLFMIMGSGRKQAVWDKVAGTVVVVKPPVTFN